MSIWNIFLLTFLFICSSSKRFPELEIAIQLRVEKISEFHLLKIALNINKKQHLSLPYSQILSIVTNSQNNINYLLNSLQSIINNTNDNHIILNDILHILHNKNILSGYKYIVIRNSKYDKKGVIKLVDMRNYYLSSH